MRSDNRLSRMLHALIHMDQGGGPMTSEAMAQMLSTNAVVVRRTMAGLRERGCVQSGKGHGGGWVLVRSLAEISLLDVYEALGEPSIFALGLADDHPQCLVEQAVNAGLSDALRGARAVLLARFGEITLADLAQDFEKRAKAVEKAVEKAGMKAAGKTSGKAAATATATATARAKTTAKTTARTTAKATAKTTAKAPTRAAAPLAAKRSRPARKRAS